MIIPATHRFESLPSTQDTVHELALGGAPSGTAVVAQVQTLGRGSRGRGWESPLGGLWMSVLCRPPEEPAMEVLSLRIALAVATTLERTCPGVALLLKWPNDLILGGRKLGGILCEARWHGGTIGWVAVGLGINVANAIPEPLGRAAIALSSAAGTVAPESLADPLARAIADAGQRRGPLTAGELAEFHARDWLRGKQLLAPEKGIADGIAADGSLRIRSLGGGVTEFRTGTVLLASEADESPTPLTSNA
jgi:BirA family biotin operon repressor/biotin-[acetyl-CoA-carboxylase] ligase